MLVQEPPHARGRCIRRSTYELSQRRSLEFGANFTDVSFDQQIPGAQVDYRNGDLTAGLHDTLLADLVA